MTPFREGAAAGAMAVGVVVLVGVPTALLGPGAGLLALILVVLLPVGMSLERSARLLGEFEDHDR